jgi:hypothetical protein
MDRAAMDQAGVKWTRLREFVCRPDLKTWARFKKGRAGNGLNFV